MQIPGATLSVAAWIHGGRGVDGGLLHFPSSAITASTTWSLLAAFTSASHAAHMLRGMTLRETRSPKMAYVSLLAVRTEAASSEVSTVRELSRSMASKRVMARSTWSSVSGGKPSNGTYKSTSPPSSPLASPPSYSGWSNLCPGPRALWSLTCSISSSITAGATML